MSKSKRDIEIKPIICSSSANSATIDVFGINRHVRIQQLIVCARNVLTLFDQSIGVDCGALKVLRATLSRGCFLVLNLLNFSRTSQMVTNVIETD